MASPPAASSAVASSASAPNAAARDVLGIDDLALRARLLADTFMAGHHASLHFGRSSEFAEHKVYTPGDDLRALDWRAYARMDRYYVRRYFDDKRIDVTLVVDASASMAYAGGATAERSGQKWRYATTLAGAVALLAQRQGDAPGVTLFAGEEEFHLPPRARADHVEGLLRGLDGHEVGSATHFSSVLEGMLRRPSRRGLVVVLSDFFDVDPDVLDGFAALRQRGSDVVIAQVLHRDEVAFHFDGVVRFLDMEGEREAIVDAPAVQKAYLEEFAAFQDALRQKAKRLDFRFLPLVTDESPRAALRDLVLPQVRPR